MDPKLEVASATSLSSTATPTLVFGAINTGMISRRPFELCAGLGIESGGTDQDGNPLLCAGPRMQGNRVAEAEIDGHRPGPQGSAMGQR